MGLIGTWIVAKKWVILAFFALACAFEGFASGQAQYLIANDDVPLVSGVSFFTVGANGLIALKQQVQTNGAGISGGYFATSRVAVLDTASQQCAFVSNALTGNIVGIDINTLVVGGSASGSDTDSGAANGIGLVLNDQYLYAGYTASNTIGTFQLQSGCSLTFVNDVPATGLQSGFVDGMAINGNMMVVTYDDGSIESFDISSGTPVSNGDEQNSTGYLNSQGASYPNSVEITADGHYAVFGDTSTLARVEVSNLQSGKLEKTTDYLLSRTINSSNILLSPDETLLYISNTQGDTITAAAFDKTTGKPTAACNSQRLKGYSSSWSYLSQMALASNTGNGGTIYVAEFGGTSGIAMVGVSVAGGKCTLTELPGSPVVDPNSGGLLSIAAFPPRSF